MNDWIKKIEELENQLIADNALMDVIDDFVTKGKEPSDFWMSFGNVDNVVCKIEGLEKQIADLQEKNDYWLARVTEIELKDYADLQAENENMKCCGNCKNYGEYLTRQIRYCIEYEQTKISNPLPYTYCLLWQSDGLSRKEREG